MEKEEARRNFLVAGLSFIAALFALASVTVVSMGFADISESPFLMTETALLVTAIFLITVIFKARARLYRIFIITASGMFAAIIASIFALFTTDYTDVFDLVGLIKFFTLGFLMFSLAGLVNYIYYFSASEK